MFDRAKVTQMCKEAIDSGEPQCNYEFYYSVIALLKEQETVVPLTIDDAVSEIMDKHYKRLKEQEAEPFSHLTDDSDLYFTCGKCGHVIWSESYKYCPMCATRIAWNGEGR